MSDVARSLDIAAEHYRDLPALISNEATISYGEYRDLADAAALKLEENGVRTGDRIAVVSDNRPEYPVLLQALWRLGAVACLVSPRFPPRTIHSLLRKAACHTVIDPLGLFADKSSGKIRTINLDSLVIPAGTKASSPPHDWAFDPGVATIIFTSGSSGEPGAVAHSYDNHYYSALGSNGNIAVQPGDRWLLSLPLYHVGGLGILFRTMLGGGAVVLPAQQDSIAKSIDVFDVTHVSLVFTQLSSLLNEGISNAAGERLKAVLVGGSAVPVALIQRAHEVGLPVFATYGLTEMASQVTTTSPGDDLRRLLTSGKLLDYRQLKISDSGEVLVKGRTLFKGYARGNGAMSLSLDTEGWFHTGDLGQLDNDGYLKMLGRKDSMFISGGENIHPEEIEGVVSLLPDIAEAVVVPTEDEVFGLRPVAFVRTASGLPPDRKDLVSKLERNLPRFKIPVKFYQWPRDAEAKGLKLNRRYFETLASQPPSNEIS